MVQRSFYHIFINEEWVFLTQKPAKYYLLLDEDDPDHTSKSKNYIPCVMFLGVSGHLMFHHGVGIFYGKIGCFPPCDL
jgi:hypothetical protein